MIKLAKDKNKPLASSWFIWTGEDGDEEIEGESLAVTAEELLDLCVQIMKQADKLKEERDRLNTS